MVATIAPPVNVGMVLAIQPDGSFRQMLGEVGIAGMSGLGSGVVCVINMGVAVQDPAGVNIKLIYANALFPAPFNQRYVLDFGQMKVTGVF